MKKRTFIRNGAFYLRQRIFSALKRLRYNDKKIKKFAEVHSLNKNLIIFSVTESHGYVKSYDFYIKTKEEIDRNNFYGLVKHSNNRNTFYFHIDETFEGIHKFIHDVLIEIERGHANEEHFFKHINHCIRIVSKDRTPLVLEVLQSSPDENLAHGIDGWIKVVRKNRWWKKYPIQLKSSFSGIKTGEAHLSSTRKILFIRYDLKTKTKPGEIVRRLENGVRELTEKTVVEVFL